jgi:hypothetical protein
LFALDGVVWTCIICKANKPLKSFQQTSLQSRGDSEAGVPQDQGPQIPINSQFLVCESSSGGKPNGSLASPDFGEHWTCFSWHFVCQFIWGRSSQFAESPDSCDQIFWECEQHPCCFQDFSASVGAETSRKVPSEVSSSKRCSMSHAHPDHPASFASKCVAQIFVCNFYMLFAPHFSGILPHPELSKLNPSHGDSHVDRLEICLGLSPDSDAARATATATIRHKWFKTFRWSWERERAGRYLPFFGFASGVQNQETMVQSAKAMNRFLQQEYQSARPASQTM